MRLLPLFTFSALFIAPAFSQELLARLNEAGLDGFSQMLAVSNPALVDEISKRNDVTVWAPGNAHVAAIRKRQDGDDNGSRTSAQVDHTPPPQFSGLPGKRQVGQGPSGYPDTNFQTITTFLNDSRYVNLGPNQPARFTKNYAASLDGGTVSLPIVEVVTGLGDSQFTIRGPFKFANGVFYEVNAFFTLPQPFTATMEHMNIAQQFYNTVVSSGKHSTFEETPAVTIFAPIDSTYTGTVNPEAYILTGSQSLYYSPNMMPGSTLVATSGDVINITWAPNGERLVNCRHLVRANVPMKNGIIHFIDGPLYGSGGCNGNVTTPPGNSTTRPPPAQIGAAARQSYAAGALVLAFVASLLAFS